MRCLDANKQGTESEDGGAFGEVQDTKGAVEQGEAEQRRKAVEGPTHLYPGSISCLSICCLVVSVGSRVDMAVSSA